MSMSPSVRLPDNMPLNELLIFIQASLDRIKPVLLIAVPLESNEISLPILKGSHFKIVDHRYLFLNYSIRNLLTKLNQKNFCVKSFDEMACFFSENLLLK